MNKSIHSAFPNAALLAILLCGCGPAATPPPSTPTLTPVPPTYTPTFTPEPTSTPTPIPSPTPLPGSLVLPIETMGDMIPWLPMDASANLSVNFVGFNTALPPFNSAVVRQAFAYAVDRDPLMEMVRRYGGEDATPATSLTPPDTLGRDLYGEVGIVFDPERARALLTEAGYPDPSTFPSAVFLISSYGGMPGARFNMANAMADMWETHLGVTVQVLVIQGLRDYYDRLGTNPPELFWYGWAADYNDPDNFLRALFQSQSQYNNGNFSDPEFDRLVDLATRTTDPAERQALYIQAERLLCETDAALIPLFHD